MLALILGILGVLCCQILAPVALFIGRASMTRIDASRGALGGRGLAQAGFILGIIGTIFLALGIVYLIVAVITSAGHISG